MKCFTTFVLILFVLSWNSTQGQLCLSFFRIIDWRSCKDIEANALQYLVLRLISNHTMAYTGGILYLSANKLALYIMQTCSMDIQILSFKNKKICILRGFFAAPNSSWYISQPTFIFCLLILIWNIRLVCKKILYSIGHLVWQHLLVLSDSSRIHSVANIRVRFWWSLMIHSWFPFSFLITYLGLMIGYEN